MRQVGPQGLGELPHVQGPLQRLAAVRAPQGRGGHRGGQLPGSGVVWRGARDPGSLGAGGNHLPAVLAHHSRQGREHQRHPCGRASGGGELQVQHGVKRAVDAMVAKHPSHTLDAREMKLFQRVIEKNKITLIKIMQLNYKILTIFQKEIFSL